MKKLLLFILFTGIIFSVAFGQPKRRNTATTLDVTFYGVSIDKRFGLSLGVEGLRFYKDYARGFGMGYNYVLGMGVASYHKVAVRYVGTLIKDPQDIRSKSTAKRGLLFFSIGTGPYLVTDVTGTMVYPGFDGRLEARIKPPKRKFIIPLSLGGDFMIDWTQGKFRRVYGWVSVGLRFKLGGKDL